MLIAQPLAVVMAFTAISAANPTGWNLVWSDEFSGANGSAPDPTKWAHDIGGGGWGNNELQYYTERTVNSRLENGNLVIEARAESYGGRSYTSARLLTRNKASWTYGRMEARIRIPRGSGIWPAFWMLGNDIGTAGWPACGEIDIMENIGSLPATLYGTVHGPGYSGANGISGSVNLQSGALADDFHIYAIEWEENRIRWFLDGVQYFTLTPASLPNGAAWVFNKPQFFLLNIAVGGNWPGNPDATTIFPQRMTVDYVRVYTASVPPEHVGINPADTWKGYMNVSELPANGGGYLYGSVWDPADLRATFESGALVVRPNTIADPSPYWYVGGGGPGRPGNKRMAASMYVEKTGTLSGKSVVFTGMVTANTLTQAHQAKAFIRDFTPTYSSSSEVSFPLRDGPFRIRLNTAAGTGRHVQFGVETTGVNVWSTDAGPFGFMRINSVDGDPFATWITGFENAENPAFDLTESGDPDGDGQNNLTEFALHGNPFSGTTSAFVSTRIGNVADSPSLVLTLPVRGNTAFGGAPSKSTSVDGVKYTVVGSLDLKLFDHPIEEVIPAMVEGMPALQSGWNYRSFRLGSGMSPAAGFMRVEISSTP